MSVFDLFEKKHDFLVCVDSDGCAMDTMNCKHFYCFGPCMVDEWKLDAWRDEISERWNEINLYQMTRGINRFKGLSLALSEIDKKYMPIPGVETLRTWTETATALSNDALCKSIDEAPECEGKDCLLKALAWSNAVNLRIENLSDELKTPFFGAKSGLAAAHEFADVAVVSSANRGAVDDEWTAHGLYEHVDIVLAQDCGSKAHCISEMLKFGYAPERVLMVGDAPGDMDAADKNGVFFYPILVNHESESWADLKNTALPMFRTGSYDGEYQDKVRRFFLTNLGG